MELKQYWHVIWKRRWLVLAIVGLTAIISAALFLTSKPSYQAEVRFITRQEPSPDNASSPGVTGSPGNLVFTFNRYYNWFGSEFLVDDYTQIVESDAMANSVLQEMSKTLSLGKGRDKLTVNDIKDSLQADRKHRELHVQVTGASKDEAKAMADAVTTVLTDAKLKPLKGTMVDDKPVFSEIDEATLDEIKSTRGKDLTNAAIRVIVGLVAALALAFLLEYLDSSVRDERDAARVLELPVLGTIPKSR